MKSYFICFCFIWISNFTDIFGQDHSSLDLDYDNPGNKYSIQIDDKNEITIKINPNSRDESEQNRRLKLVTFKYSGNDFNAADKLADGFLVYVLSFDGILEAVDFKWPAKVDLYIDGKIKSEITVVNNNSNNNQDLSDTKIREITYNYIEQKYKKLLRYKDSRKNLLIDGDNIVHVFIDETGYYLTELPLTAQENYTYQFHLIYLNASSKYNFTYEGEFTPELNIYGENLKSTVGASASSSAEEDKEYEVKEIKFGPIGPFTGSFNVKLQQINKEYPNGRYLINKEIIIAKLYHVSLSTGLLSTTLRNPQNIVVYQKPDGDSTLVADDPNSRGLFAFFATFYPKGRSFLFPPKGDLFSSERFGVIVGVSLDDNFKENFFGGLQFDFARGGSFCFGVHYGKRSIIVDNKDFKFGSDSFSGTLENKVKSEWGVSPFLGVNLDLRIVQYFFKPIGSQ